MREFQRLSPIRRTPSAPPVRRGPAEDGLETSGHPLLALQRSVGNQATLSALASPGAEVGAFPSALRMPDGVLARQAAPVISLPREPGIPAGPDLAPPRASAGVPSAAALDEALEAMRKGTLALDDASTWAVLAEAAGPRLAFHAGLLEFYFQRRIDRGEVTFETITPDQRRVFRSIPSAARETLRQKAIVKSQLYKVLTDMQLNPAYPSRRDAVNTRRMGPPQAGDFYPDALAGKFGRGEIMADMLVTEVPRTPNPGNGPLAQYVLTVLSQVGGDRSRAKERLVRETLKYACGLANLFALSTSRSATPATEAEALAWLKKMVLDPPPAQALVTHDGGWDIQFDPALRSVSTGGKEPVRSGGKVSLRGPGGPAALQGIMAYANALKSRVGIVQGAKHMFLVYRDIDGEWRTMDMYMGLADNPEGGSPDEAGTKFEKVVVDQ